MKKNKAAYTLPAGNGDRWANTEVLRELERQFRDAQKVCGNLHLQRFVDGQSLVRGPGRGRFRWLAARAAKAAGRPHRPDPCEPWIEILIQYLLDYDADQEYITIRPAAVYVHPDKTSPPPSEFLDVPWNQP